MSDGKINGVSVLIPPSEVILEIKIIVAQYPNRSHLFEWGDGNFLFLGLDGDNDFVRAPEKKDVEYLREREKVRAIADSKKAIKWNLTKRDNQTAICQDPITKMWTVSEPNYEFYFDRQHHRHVMRKVPVASDLKTRKKYYCRKLCENCHRIFFSVRKDSRFCNMRTCQKRKKSNVMVD